MDLKELKSQVESWIQHDPDEASREELRQLLHDEAFDELKERFSAPLHFGTAGLRGIMGAGPGRMNIATITQVAYAVGLEAIGNAANAKERGIVVGRDGRQNSERFARVVAEVLAALGIRVHWIAKAAPTPIAAYLGKHFGAAGVCIVTASHNPPEYNGFKVYGESASQIVPPQDERIRKERDKASDPSAISRLSFREATEKGLIQVVKEQDLEAYFEALDKGFWGPKKPPKALTLVTTALHGVGHEWVHEALLRYGFLRTYPVLEQAFPDGRFPSVRFPNPEEKGALDLALQLAREKDADLILANDPDTDRLALAVKDPSNPKTGYRVLSGNEVGLLLGDWVLSMGKESPQWPSKPLVLCSLVSTMMLERLAKARGASYREVLTGFKWVWNEALRLEKEGYSYVYGFEEALGYSIGPLVRDKDGVHAALAAAMMASYEAASGRSLLDRLDRLSKEIGLSKSDQIAFVWPGLSGMARISRVMAYLRKEGLSEIPSLKVVRSRDLEKPEGEWAHFPSSNVLTWWLDDGSRIIARPSGTEPKLKIYLESFLDLKDATLEEGKEALSLRVQELKELLHDMIEKIV